MEKEIDISKPNWSITAKRYVCFLDVMGFKDLVSRRSHRQVFSLMKKLSDAKNSIRLAFDENENKKYHDIIYTTSFSDSIVVFTKDNSKTSLIALVAVAIPHLMQSALSKGIPMKGALAFGEMSIDKEGQIFFGQPLIDAYLLQEDVYYYGVVVHNSAELLVSKTPTNKHFIDISTPLKSGNISHYNINWFDHLKKLKQKDFIIKKKFGQLVSKHRSLTSGRPRKYLDNTIQVFKQIYPD